MAHRVTVSCPAALLALGAGAFALPAGAQTGSGQGESSGTPSIVVTATRLERNSFDLPVSIDRIDADAIREGKPMINLSESLPRVPGVVVLNRQNYSQDLQISSRGSAHVPSLACAVYGSTQMVSPPLPQTARGRPRTSISARPKG